MKGKILDYSIQNNTGIISGDDEKRYQFNGAEWREQHVPFRGQNVDFDIGEFGQAKDVYALQSNSIFPTQVGSKSRLAAILLAFFLGGFGVHKFYLGQVVAGIFYLLFCWTFIPSIIAFIEFIIYICMSDEDFAKKYG